MDSAMSEHDMKETLMGNEQAYASDSGVAESSNDRIKSQLGDFLQKTAKSDTATTAGMIGLVCVILFCLIGSVVVVQEHNNAKTSGNSTSPGELGVQSYSVLQLTDFHYDSTNRTCSCIKIPAQGYQSYCCNAQCALSRYGTFGAMGCDANLNLIDSAVSYAQSLTGKSCVTNNGDKSVYCAQDLRFTLFTGDFAGHDSPDEQTTLNEVEATYSNLKENLPDVPFIAAIGNDDVFPDYCSSNALQNRLAEIFEHSLKCPNCAVVPDYDKNLASFKQGGYYSVQPVDGLVVAVLNTLLYSPRFENCSGIDTGRGTQMAWLENILQTSQSEGQQVWIVGHIPFGVNVDESPRSAKIEAQTTANYTDQFRSLVERYSDTVTGMMFGHTHRDDYKVVNYGKFHPGMLVAGSVSPIFVNNPAVRTYKVQKGTNYPIDFGMHYMDLVRSNMLGIALWKPGMSYIDSFGQYINGLEVSKPFNMLESYLGAIQDNASLFSLYSSARTMFAMPFRRILECAMQWGDLSSALQCQGEGGLEPVDWSGFRPL